MGLDRPGNCGDGHQNPQTLEDEHVTRNDRAKTNLANLPQPLRPRAGGVPAVRGRLLFCLEPALAMDAGSVAAG